MTPFPDSILRVSPFRLSPSRIKQPSFLPFYTLSETTEIRNFGTIEILDHMQLVRVPKVVILPQFRVHKNLT